MQLGRYQILKQLASGDFADVWLARASGLEGFARHVVIKRIRPELASEERLVEAFLAEARIAGALHHHNVVQVHDIGEQDGAYYFAMEYVHGADVRQLLAHVRQRGELVPLERVIGIVTATASGLHHAHEQRGPTGEPLGLVHRDVCPANILLGYDGSVKLVDFGMARAALRSVKTATGLLKVKASYMSPEQCCGKQVDRRTDTFALGIVLYELLTARRLFRAANEYLTMAAIVEGQVPPPSSVRADLPPALDEIVLRALARTPGARYQTAEDLRAALERFAIEQELRTSNKALADYFAAQFGPRLEPWHELTEPEVPPPAVRDDAQEAGIVAAPGGEVDVIARYAPRMSAPIMLAQTLADPAAAASERAAAGGETDGSTVVAPPLFVDEEATIQQDDLAALETATGTGDVGEVPEDDDDNARTLDGTPARPPAATPSRPHTLAGVGLDQPLPPRASSERLYVGPPAPPPSQGAIAQTFFGSYRRSILVGATAGLVTLLIAGLALRSCSGHAAPAPHAPAATRSGPAR